MPERRAHCKTLTGDGVSRPPVFSQPCRVALPKAENLCLMQAAPNTQFLIIAQAVLFPAAGISVIWPNLPALAAIGTALGAFALARFRKAIVTMA